MRMTAAMTPDLSLPAVGETWCSHAGAAEGCVAETHRCSE